MTLPLVPTLGEIRRSVATRCGLATSGNLLARSKDLLDQHIVAEQWALFRRASWCRTLQEYVIPLVTAQTDYDLLALTTPGCIHRIASKNADNKYFYLKYDDTLDLYNYPSTAASRPAYWQIINDQLRVLPATDATEWPSLLLTVTARPANLVNDDDRPVVDAEALIRAATILHKEYLGIGGDQSQARMDLKQYMLDLRSDSSPGRTFNIASADPNGPAYWDVPTVDAATTPYSPSWNPPGSW